MKLAFYKGQGTWMDKLIRWWTEGKYSHCELVFSNGEFFSADAWTNRVRYVHFNPNPDHWDFVDLEIGPRGEMMIRAWCDAQVGKKYDYLGLLGFVLPLNLEMPQRFFCSEICVKALQWIGILPWAVSFEIHPNKLRTLL